MTCVIRLNHIDFSLAQAPADVCPDVSNRERPEIVKEPNIAKSLSSLDMSRSAFDQALQARCVSSSNRPFSGRNIFALEARTRIGLAAVKPTL